MADNDNGMTTVARTAGATTGFDRVGVTLQPEPMLGVGKIQFERAQAETIFEQAFGETAPPAGRSLTSGSTAISWLAPGEWLVTGSEADVDAVLARADAIAGDLGLGTDLTHGRVSFLLSGKDSRDRLAALTPLDVSAAVFSVGDVARAPLGDTGMFLARLPDSDGKPNFRIIVDQTMGAYAERMLAGPKSTSGAFS